MQIKLSPLSKYLNNITHLEKVLAPNRVCFLCISSEYTEKGIYIIYIYFFFWKVMKNVHSGDSTLEHELYTTLHYYRAH